MKEPNYLPISGGILFIISSIIFFPLILILAIGCWLIWKFVIIINYLLNKRKAMKKLITEIKLTVMLIRFSRRFW